MKILILITSLVLVSCASQKQFTAGSYNDVNEVNLLNDKFNEADMHQISRTMTKSIVQCPKVYENMPTMVFGEVVNQTEEHLNLDSVMDQIQDQVVKSNRFVVIDKKSRGQIDEEERYQQAKNVYQDSSPAKANYILTGSISSNVQEYKDQKMVYYKMNLKITDMKTTAVVCSEEKELRKQFVKK